MNENLTLAERKFLLAFDKDALATLADLGLVVVDADDWHALKSLSDFFEQNQLAAGMQPPRVRADNLRLAVDNTTDERTETDEPTDR